jgi:hypothetical protein
VPLDQIVRVAGEPIFKVGAITQRINGMHHPVGVSPVIPELLFFGLIQKIAGLVMQILYDLNELIQNGA